MLVKRHGFLCFRATNSLWLQWHLDSTLDFNFKLLHSFSKLTLILYQSHFLNLFCQIQIFILLTIINWILIIIEHHIVFCWINWYSSFCQLHALVKQIYGPCRFFLVQCTLLCYDFKIEVEIYVMSSASKNNMKGCLNKQVEWHLLPQ